jgi:aspartate/methionine/tyrosine aminotransferase
LGTSGIAGYPLKELPMRIEDLEINGESFYGYAPLVERLAKKNGVARENVMYAMGTSFANALAFSALIEPGDEVLTETPGYELIDTTLKFFGAELRYYERRFENEYQVEVDEIRRKMTPKTKLIVITNLHNPSGVMTDEKTLRAVGDLARSVGARVLVDEVYLELLFEKRPQSAFHLDPKTFVVTNSLTKAYGLSGIRCGWVLADEETVDRMWHLADVYYGIPAHPAERLGVIALDNLSKVAERAKGILAKNRPALKALLESRKDLDYVPNEYATTVFPRMKKGAVEQLDRILREKYETSVVPGRYFSQPRHIRVGIGGDPEMTAEGLRRLAKALDEL